MELNRMAKYTAPLIRVKRLETEIAFLFSAPNTEPVIIDDGPEIEW